MIKKEKMEVEILPEIGCGESRAELL